MTEFKKSCKKIKLRTFMFVFIVLTYIYIFSLLFKNSINIYVLLNEILCASVAFSIGIICFMNRDLKSGGFHKNIGAGFLVISVVSFIYIFLNYKYIFNSFSFYVNDNLGKANYYLEYLIILTAYILENINKKIKYELLVSIKLPLGVILFMFISYMAKKLTNFDILSMLILGIVLILDISIIYINKLNLKRDEVYTLYFYIFLISLYQYIGIRHNIFGDMGVIIALSIKFLSYYIIFLSVSKCVMKQSYDMMKEELIDVQTTQKELNNILKNRNKTLLELEHIIEKSSQKYSDLIEQISDGIVIFYFNKIYYINSEAKKSLEIDENVDKYSFDDFTEMILTKNKIIERYEFVKKNIKDIGSLKKENFRFNLCNYSGIQYEIYFFNIDSITRLVYIKDVTEANRNYEFKRKYKEYLKGEKLKNEFYSNISHELRTPINLIYSALQLSEINLSDNKIESLEKHNETIKHNCLRLIRTINNFIDANKISEGYLKPNFKVYNIVSVVENISLACDSYMKKIRNELIFDSEEEEFYVRCDKEMIERIVLNILSNSVKFGKNGGMTTVNITADYDIVTIQIKNNGYIVSDEEKPYIFDKFTKVNKSLNRSNEGSGLGLYLSKALVELNNGRIELESNKDIGTEFTIVFPRTYRMDECEIEENYDMIGRLSEKVDIEFSDIYI